MQQIQCVLPDAQGRGEGLNQEGGDAQQDESVPPEGPPDPERQPMQMHNEGSTHRDRYPTRSEP